MRACVRACVHVGVRACVRALLACVRACAARVQLVRACVRAGVRAFWACWACVNAHEQARHAEAHDGVPVLRAIARHVHRLRHVPVGRKYGPNMVRERVMATSIHGTGEAGRQGRHCRRAGGQADRQAVVWYARGQGQGSG